MSNRVLTDTIRLPSQSQVKVGMSVDNTDTLPTQAAGGIRGEVFIALRDLDGNLLEHRHLKNLILLDASILIAILLKDSSTRSGLTMLAVGSGATGALLSPDAPDNRQRNLNAELARKAFSSTTFRDSDGNAVAYPTNIVDFTTVFGAGDAVGALNEMSLVSTISMNPLITNNNPNVYPTRDTTLDVSTYDIFANRLCFPVISVPVAATIAFTWRLTC